VRATVLVPLPLVLALCLGPASCDEDASRRRSSASSARPPGSASAVAEADGGESASADPPALAGDLQADLDAFTTVDACVAAHAGVDPLVGDALEGIGYDTLLRDACRALEAAKTRSTRPCDDIAASSLRARCVARVAAIQGEPDACPWDVATRPERGRDPVCLALATGDPRLCAAALERVDRVSCEAITGHDAAPCARLTGHSERGRCERDAKRWGRALPSKAAPVRSGDAPQGKATILEANDAGSASFPVDLSRGVVVVERIDGAHVAVGSSLELGSGFVVPSPDAQGSLSLELVIPADSRKARVDGGELHRPGRPTVSFDGSQAAALVVRVGRFDRTRGGPVELTVSGTLHDGLHVDATVSTFVRDVVKSSALLGPTRFGDAGWMR
jgi:hypothetical protein